MYDETRFPNLLKLLQTGYTLLVTSSECERSFTCMRTLRKWLRESMYMHCLRYLAAMNIRKDMGIDHQDVAKKLIKLQPQKINENNLIDV